MACATAAFEQSCRHIHTGIDEIVLDVQEGLVASLSSKKELELVVQDEHVVLLQAASSKSSCKTAGELCDAILEVVATAGICARSACWRSTWETKANRMVQVELHPVVPHRASP